MYPSLCHNSFRKKIKLHSIVECSTIFLLNTAERHNSNSHSFFVASNAVQRAHIQIISPCVYPEKKNEATSLNNCLGYVNRTCSAKLQWHITLVAKMSTEMAAVCRETEIT
ncbi:Uncharacterised protein at_DN0091 [Pycnogonum litorale]